MVVQVSPTPIIGQDAAVDCAASHRNLDVGSYAFAHPEADVERSYSVCIRLNPLFLKIRADITVELLKGG